MDTKRCFSGNKRGLLDRIGEEAVFWLFFLLQLNEPLCGGNDVSLLLICKHKAQKFVPPDFVCGAQRLANINNF